MRDNGPSGRSDMPVSGHSPYPILHINWGPEMREIRRTPWETRWCFKCRKRLPHDAVVMAPVEPSYYGPHVNVECHGCHGDHVHFPGTWDGPTLVLEGED